MSVRAVKFEKRVCPHCHELDALFDRVRRIELFLALIAGGILAGGGAIGSKVFGLL